MLKYRIGTDGVNSWTLQKRTVQKQKDGTKVDVYQNFKWFSQLENAAHALLDISARCYVAQGESIIESVKNARNDVIHAIQDIGMEEAKQEISKECKAKMEGE